MKEKNAEAYKIYAARTLAEIYGLQDHEIVLKALQTEGDDVFEDISPDKFGLEYLAARLALAAHAWVRGCQEGQIKDREIENLFFKTVMASFKSSKFVGIAEAFGVYLHAPEAEKRSVLAICLMMMRRLGTGDKILEKGKPLLPVSFQVLISAAESFKEKIENDFFDFSLSE